MYDVASLTKPIVTTTAAMLLVQQGRLDLDRPSSAICRIRDCRKSDPDPTWRARVTLRMLLLHDSGLPGASRLLQGREGPRRNSRARPRRAASSRARHAGRIFRPRVHPARRNRRASDRRIARHICEARFSGARNGPLHVQSAAQTARRHRAHGNGLDLPQAPHLGRSARRKRLGHGRRRGTCGPVFAPPTTSPRSPR